MAPVRHPRCRGRIATFRVKTVYRRGGHTRTMTRNIPLTVTRARTRSLEPLDPLPRQIGPNQEVGNLSSLGPCDLLSEGLPGIASDFDVPDGVTPLTTYFTDFVRHPPAKSPAPRPSIQRSLCMEKSI